MAGSSSGINGCAESIGRRRFIDAALDQSTWELESPLLYFHNLQNRYGKINAHATRTLNAVPDLAIVEMTVRGRLCHMKIPTKLRLSLMFP
jgi:hypothetical protein